MLRNWLFRLLFGIQLKDFVLGNSRAFQLRKDLDDLRSEIEELKEVVVETIGLTGGKGFPETVINAIGNLDARTLALVEGFQAHQEALHMLSTDYIHVGSLADPSQLKHGGN
jgi:hypothetical protein